MLKIILFYITLIFLILISFLYFIITMSARILGLFSFLVSWATKECSVDHCISRIRKRKFKRNMTKVVGVLSIVFFYTENTNEKS